MTVFAGQWTQMPARVWEDRGLLHVEPKPRSDFWRDPRNGYEIDNGHLLGRLFDADVSCEVQVGGQFSAEYDQCGLMLRVDPEHWVKVALDFVDGRIRIATVVTIGVSDSALQQFSGASSSCWFRVSWIGGVVIVEARPSRDERYEVIRLARLARGGSYWLGPMCCAPTREHFTATFTELSFGPPSTHIVA